jgi:hypothetical protein
MSVEVEVASKIWPEHAEMCSQHDWAVLESAVAKDRSPDGAIVSPVGEARDVMMASLLVLYWTMKIVRVALQIANEVKDMHGDAKTRTVVSAVQKRLSSDTPKIVSDRIMEIVKAIDS